MSQRRREAPGTIRFTSAELSLERYMGEADPAEGRGWWTDTEWWGMVHSAQSALQARLAKAQAAEGRPAGPKATDVL